MTRITFALLKLSVPS